MQPAITSVELECRKICFFRCIYAVGFSIGTQFLLLTIFLFFVNFNIWHPISWLRETIGYIFSVYTWIAISPLICAIVVYGILLGKSHLSVIKYHPTRFSWIWNTAIRKAMFFGTHLSVGLLTAWFYSRFLHQDYRNLTMKCFDGDCLNTHYTFILLAGMSAGFYYFVKQNLRNDSHIEYPVIQQKIYVQIRSLLYSVLYSSLTKSFMPTLCFVLTYWITNDYLNKQICSLLNAEPDDSLASLLSILSNLRLNFYVWLLTWHILSNMRLMDQFFSIMLTQEINFPIEKNPVMLKDYDAVVTLTEALALDKVPVIQHLAALDLYNLSASKMAEHRRKQIFALSIPGGHPYNWNHLSDQCLSLIANFTDELASSVKTISNIRNIAKYTNLREANKEAIDKILLRQYNETYGIRRMVADEQSEVNRIIKPESNLSDRVNDAIEQFNRKLEEALRSAFHTIPGLFYMFGEADGSRTEFLLSNCQTIIWITQGISEICANSLVEDKYGVVQNAMPNIIVTLLRLKLELDKLNNVKLNGKNIDRNFIALKNAVKRSLYIICAVFGDYMRELVDSPEDYKHLQCFLNYQET